ncbi:ATP-dependent Clp protease proteolytic subunit, partial [Salmonella enterica subsp. enterica serovar Eastbourne]|nr:ATP-dependent Clp protease proteolytic subunit [Salmonella enterica subsp. enterica serovar Eastbourne]
MKTAVVIPHICHTGYLPDSICCLCDRIAYSAWSSHRIS